MTSRPEAKNEREDPRAPTQPVVLLQDPAPEIWAEQGLIEAGCFRVLHPVTGEVERVICPADPSDEEIAYARAQDLIYRMRQQGTAA